MAYEGNSLIPTDADFDLYHDSPAEEKSAYTKAYELCVDELGIDSDEAEGIASEYTMEEIIDYANEYRETVEAEAADVEWPEWED